VADAQHWGHALVERLTNAPAIAMIALVATTRTVLLAREKP
jgi:hypothetical protein